jgi:5-oxoprolinase (ATP-hydrolysing)
MDWQFWIDRGGTFTDIVARRPDGASSPTSCCPRIPSSTATPPWPASATCWACAGRRRCRRAIEAVKMGTTVATNALLERKGEPTVLAITRGFRDALRIAYQNRPRLFDRHIVLPELLYSA